MSYEYEDELDRMRARRQGRQVRKSSRYEDDYEQEYGEYDPEYEDEYNDYDDVYEDLDEYGDYDEDDYDHGRNSSVTRDRNSRSPRAGRRGPERRRTKGRNEDRNPRAGRRDSTDNSMNRQAGGRRRPEPGGRKPRKKRRAGRVFLVLFAIMLAAGGIYFYMNRRHKDGYWTIAIFGVDSRDGNLGKGTLADVQMICNINERTGEIQLISVFRDTYMRIDSKGNYHKINEAYFKGGASQAVEALNVNLDLEIDDYATFNWKAVADAINLLGGIELEISDSEFKYINSFITETVEETGVPSKHLEHSGMNDLDGAQAVAYARLRLMDDDYTRTARQRKVISLAMEKAKQADWAVLNNILVTVLPQVSTSVGVDDLIPIARNVKRYQITETAGFPFSRTTAMVGTKDCVVATTLESNVIQLHQMLYPNINYSPSSTLKKISVKIGEETGYTEAGKNAGASNPGKGGSSGQGQSNQNQPAPAAPPSDTQPESTVEESTQESIVESTEETTVEDMFDMEESDSRDDADMGPGVVKPTSPDQSASGDKPTRPDPDDSQGPGVETASPPTEAVTQPPVQETTQASVQTPAPPVLEEPQADGGGPGAE